MLNNALFNDVFLNELFHQRERAIYARITSLTYKEEPIESIEGRVSGGSINVDGDSAIRRTCSINLVAPNTLEYNEFYWGVKNKFKLEIGLSNNVDDSYEQIIWFPQGIFLITNFDINYTTKKCDISIKGKDKMCLLNGEVGGLFPHSTTLHNEEYHDLETDTVTYTDIPIKTIIQEMVKNFGDELPQNIIINGVEEAGLELLEYRGSSPMYLLRTINNDIFENITFNGQQECYYLDESLQLVKTVIGDSEHIVYDNLVNLEGEREPTKIILTMSKVTQLTETDFYLGTYYVMNKEFFSIIDGHFINEFEFTSDEKYLLNEDKKYFITNNTVFNFANYYDPEETYYTIGDYYYIAKFEKGSSPGYRLTDLTYAGDLIANEGDSITSILDKIKSMLGDFEYFYNLDGKFVFQKRQKYNSSNWHNSENDEVLYNDSTLNMNRPIFSFLNNELIISIKDTLKIDNIKNDYSVWGTRKLDSGEEKKVHARYAIDKKPQFYKAYDGQYYISDIKNIPFVQKDLQNHILDIFTPMIEIGTISEAEFNTGIYYRANLEYLSSNSNFYFVNEEQKYFITLKNYIYDNQYDADIIYYQPINSFVHCVDWRELIYQMALDYRRHYHDTDFLYNIASNNINFYPTGITGYERYYVDIEGFWRELYNPNPEPISEYVSSQNAKDYQEKDTLYISNSYRKLNDKEKDQYLVDLTQLYILNYDNEITQTFTTMKNQEIAMLDETSESYNEQLNLIEEKYKNILSLSRIPQTPDLVPFLGSKYCHLYCDPNESKSSEPYFFQDSNGQMNNTNNIDILNSLSLSELYLKERGPFLTFEKYNDTGEETLRKYYYVKKYAEKPFPELIDYTQSQPEEEQKDQEEQINYDKLAQLLDEDGNPFVGKDNQLFLIQKVNTQVVYGSKQRTTSATNNNRSIYQYWVYKYPINSVLGQYPDDYVNYAALKFEEYLNTYGWDNLYIKTKTPIKFSDLDQPIQRLYYKETAKLTDYLNLIQYDNFNRLRTNHSELWAILPTLSPKNYSSLELFDTEIGNIIKKYIGTYSDEAKNKTKLIYEIQQLQTETDRMYNAKVKAAFEEYLIWLQRTYTWQIHQPYYLTDLISYQTLSYDFNTDKNTGDYWHKSITEAPETLNFWFDFINGENSLLSKYAIQTIGPRPKVVNDSGVKAIYYKEVPNIIFITSQEEKNKYDIQTGYNYIQLPQEMQNIFIISSRGKSATQAIEDLIYKHCYASESTTISTIPIYHLQPNTCIYINDKISNKNGDYLISKISIPLESKKQMSITATKVIPTIL